MRLRRTAALVASAILAVLAGGNGVRADTTGIRIRQVDTNDFPNVSVTVAIEGQALPEGITVVEGTRRVKAQSVQSLTQSGRGLDVVLAVDTSESMAGTPLEAAVTAAKQFITNLPADAMVGVVAFSGRARVVQPIDSDHEAALEALESLTHTQRGTSLYDAVGVAAKLFSGPAQHNVVLLTDGDDTASRSDLREAIGMATQANATIFSIGLEGIETSSDVLHTLSEQTDGTYVPATEQGLAGVYEGLAEGLSQQFVVTYRSSSPSGSEVLLRVKSTLGDDSAVVLFPHRPAPIRSDNERPFLDRIILGRWGPALIMGLAFAAVYCLMLVVLGRAARTRRTRDLARRIGVAPPRPDRLGDGQGRGIVDWIPEPLVQAADRIGAAGGISEKVDHRLERAALPLRSGEFLAGSAAAAAVGLLVGAALGFGTPFTVMLGVVAAAIPSLILTFAIGRRTKSLHAQLPDTLMVLASSLRAGHSFLQALDMVSKEIGEPSASEFSRVVAEVRLGRSVEAAMNALAERVGSEDFKWAVLAVNIQREVGGNLAEILDTVAETVRERETLRRQVRVLSAEGRLSVYILGALPFVLGLYIAKVNPGYLNLLFTTRLGIVMTVTAGCLMLLGLYWMRKIVNIDV